MRATLTVLFLAFTSFSAATAQESLCGEDPVATGEALLARAEALEESGNEWEPLFEEVVGFENECSQSFETDLIAVEAAWEMSDHGAREDSYRAASFVLYAVQSIEARWMDEDAIWGAAGPDEAAVEQRLAETERLAPVIEGFIAPTILRAIGSGRYYQGFDGPDETCPYQYGHIAQIEARAQLEGIMGVLEGNPADSVTLPIIPGDYRLLVLRDRCQIVADDVRLVRAFLLTQLAERAFANPGVPMPDGSAPPETLAATLIEQAQAEIAAMDTALVADNAFIKEEADALAAQIASEEGG